MRIVSREEWGAQPSKRPLTLYAPGSVKGLVYHWNGPPVNWSRDPAQVVRETQDYHLNHPTDDYLDIAYNFAIAYDGMVYEGRGISYRNGASGHNTPNNTFIAVEFMLGTGQSLTLEMEEAARELNRYILTVHPNAKRQTVHNDWFNTICPGPEVTTKAHNGLFVATIDPPSPPPPPPLEDDVYFLFKLHPDAAPGEPGEWLVTPGGEKFADTSGLSTAIPASRLTVVDLSRDKAKSLTFRNGHP